MSYTNNGNYIPTFTTTDTQISYNAKVIEPNFYSLYDVSALQAIYGVNTGTNTQDSTYTSSYTDYELQTIWDAGGTDTIDLSSAIGKSTIDLRSGTLNSVDEYSLAQIITLHQTLVNDAYWNSWIADVLTGLNTEGKLYTGENNFAIAQGVLIENIYTGSGDDIITDNEVDNYISSSFGNDKIYLGNGGSDVVDGGQGSDTIYINLNKSDIDVSLSSTDNYVLRANSFEVSFTGIEGISLADGTIYTPDILIG